MNVGISIVLSFMANFLLTFTQIFGDMMQYHNAMCFEQAIRHVHIMPE